MKKIISLALALTLTGGTAAFAQRDHNPPGQAHNPGRPPDHDTPDRRPDHDNRDRGRTDNHGNDRDDGRHNDRPRWSEGDRVPDHLRRDQYIVNDWRENNLRQPPRGYHWVRNDNNQYMMVFSVNGLIAEIVSQNLFSNAYQWSPGERLSGGYLERRFVVNDWQSRRLDKPRRGHHWVHVNGQYLLVDNKNRAIAEAIRAPR